MNSYSPWTFIKAKPRESPNKVIPKQTVAAVTISWFAYGNIDLINSIMILILNVNNLETVSCPNS